MKNLRSVLILAVVAATLNIATATTVIPPTFDQLVDDAELIFQGTCTDVKSQWLGEGAEHRIVSFVTFKVDDAVKGTPGDSYTIRMLGGTVDGKTMEVSDAPKFKVGDRDILFVEHNGQQFIPLVGIMHGRYRVQTDKSTGREMVMTEHGEAVTDVRQFGKTDHASEATSGNAAGANSNAATAQALAPSEFKAAIKAKLAGQN